MATTAESEVLVGLEEPAALGSHALVVHDPMQSIEHVRREMARLDDLELVESSIGTVTEKWLYRIPFKKDGGGTSWVEGISIEGAQQIARIRAQDGFPLKFVPGYPQAEEVMQNGHRGMRVTSQRRDARSGAEGVGMVFEPFEIYDTDRNNKPRVRTNEHTLQKALSKADRNAILSLVPKTAILDLLSRAAAQLRQPQSQRRAAPAQTPAKREIPARVAESVPQGAVAAAEAAAEQPIGKPVADVSSADYMGLSTSEQMATIAHLLEHPNVAHHKASVMAKIQAGSYDQFDAARSLITNLQNTIRAGDKNAQARTGKGAET